MLITFLDRNDVKLNFGLWQKLKKPRKQEITAKS
jgi:hypothetical protein